MPVKNWLISRLLVRQKAAGHTTGERLTSESFDALVRAHGDLLSLLATVLEREQVITGGELARLLTEFAAVTTADRPAEGRILALWAAYLQDNSTVITKLSSLH